MQIIHHGALWHRDPSATAGSLDAWREHRALLTSRALFLSPASSTSDDEATELNLRHCSSVESVRAKRSTAPTPSDDQPHLHLFRIVWADGHEELLGCVRAMHRADWVGAVW